MERRIHDELCEEGALSEGASSCASGQRSARKNSREYKVRTDLPDALPVTDAELDLLEAELADFIAELMKK